MPTTTMQRGRTEAPPPWAGSAELKGTRAPSSHGPQSTAETHSGGSSGDSEQRSNQSDPGASGRVAVVASKLDDEDCAVIISDETHEALELWQASDEEPAPSAMTTVQLMNLPQSFNTVKTAAFLAEHGFEINRSQILMVHVPCNRRKQTARGYFFVEAATPEVAQQIVETFSGLRPEGNRRALRAAITFCQRGRQAFQDMSFPEGFAPMFAP